MSKIEKPEEPEPLFTQAQVDEAVAVAKAEAKAEADKLQQRLRTLATDNAELRAMLQQVSLTGATLAAIIQSRSQ